VVHFDGLDEGFHADGGEDNISVGLEDTSLNTTDRNRSDTANLVNVLKRKTKVKVNGSGRGINGLKGIDKSGALVPLGVGGLLEHVVTNPTGDGDEGDLLDVETSLGQKLGHLGLDFIVTSLAVGDRFVVHLVDADNHLVDTKSEGEESVFTGLTVLGVTSFELTDTRGDNQNGNISLGGTSDHVLDEVSVSGGINDGEVKVLGLKLPEGDVNGDTTLALGLELIKDPGVFERSLTHLGGFLLELLDGTLVDTTALVDQVTGGGRFTGIDVSDDDEVDVSELFRHLERLSC